MPINYRGRRIKCKSRAGEDRESWVLLLISVIGAWNTSSPLLSRMWNLIIEAYHYFVAGDSAEERADIFVNEWMRVSDVSR